jgi:hypothetical protein
MSECKHKSREPLGDMNEIEWCKDCGAYRWSATKFDNWQENPWQHPTRMAKNVLGSCTCRRDGARTVTQVISGVFQCPRCGGLIAQKPPLVELDEKAVKELTQTIIHAIRAFASYGIGARIYGDGVDNVHLQKAIAAAKELEESRFGSRRAKIKWPDKKYHHTTANNAMYESSEDKEWNDAIDACIAAYAGDYLEIEVIK